MLCFFGAPPPGASERQKFVLVKYNPIAFRVDGAITNVLLLYYAFGRHRDNRTLLPLCPR